VLHYSRYFRLGFPFPTYSGTNNLRYPTVPDDAFRRVLVMKLKVQPQTPNAAEPTNRHTTQIFGLAMTTVFVVMLILNAIFY